MKPAIPYLMMLVLSASFLSVFTGCCWTDDRGTHHLIVGVGFALVTTTNCPGVYIHESHTLGASAGLDGAGIGWMQHHRVEIDPQIASNVVISVKSHRGNQIITHYPIDQDKLNQKEKPLNE